jgi:hypothetical protein
MAQRVIDRDFIDAPRIEVSAAGATGVAAPASMGLGPTPKGGCRYQRSAVDNGDADGDAMAVSPQRGFAADRLRALRLLAGSPLGATEAMMLAHGFTDDMLARLVRDGLATASPGSIHASGRSMKVTWLRITDAGRQALAG